MFAKQLYMIVYEKTKEKYNVQIKWKRFVLKINIVMYTYF